ncbi:MAG: hypothetical protein QUS11_06400 [Candidatus Fermentibacter sp.]|nr:hypothetical protein [Candidatus Fermentibacter sp.]
MAKKCPRCTMPYAGQPRSCPHCGYEFRAFDPGKCEFCGTKIKPSMDNCPNCGAPVEHAPAPPADDPDTGLPTPPTVAPAPVQTAAGPAFKIVGCVIALMVILPLLFGLVIPALMCSGTESEVTADSTLDERSVTILQAPVQDSIYRASIVEGENTVEEIWPRVITDLPDTCYYPGAYDPCAAFRFHVDGRHSLVRLDASAPIDLVMTLLGVDGEGVLSFAGWNEDGPMGTDPSITKVLQGGDYIALVTNLGGWEYGEVRFLWTVLQEEIPTLTPDTSVVLAFTDRMQRFHFFLEIEQGRDYVISTSCPDIDSYVELRTEGGSVLYDDDSGPNWNDARLSFTATALYAGEAVLVVRPYSTYTPDTGDLTLTVTSTATQHY